MAWVYYNKGTSQGSALRDCLTGLERSLDLLTDLRETMVQMRTGDGSQDAHYAVITEQFGFKNDAEARSAFEEFDSAWGKLNTDASVEFVRAELVQLFAKLRNW